MNESQQPASREDAVIWTEGLTRRFGEEVAVSDVTMTVPREKIFGFIGPSGSGKTTTIRMLTGVYEPTSGRASVLGSEPAGFDQRTRARIGYMPQLFVLYPELTVWENLSFVASLYGMPLRRKKRLEEVLDFVELTEDRKKVTSEISGGMQRRLSLATTLVHEPDLIFLDEPTAGIDPVLRRKFWDHFRYLREQGRSLFVTTQYVSEAAYCDLVGVLTGGRLLMVDTPMGLRYQAYGGDIVDLRTEERIPYPQRQDLADLPYVRGRPESVSESHLRLVVDEAATAVMELLEWCKEQEIAVESVEEYQPPFEDVFVELVKENGGAR
ncbi:MAG: ABC transporter ATP-binding protein [Candidatus Promineifilaceae bacterium]|nr:ABC transporter ATP-binding protein [Candidatus Promineifilaceae bacterium]